MGVGKRTSNAAIWGDCGRPPIIVRFVKQMTDYFNRLSKLDVEDSNTLVRYAFAEQKNLCVFLVQESGLDDEDTRSR